MTPERREDGPLTWRDALGPSDEREEAAGIIEELLDAVGIGVQARAHAADLVTRLRATPVADTAGIDALPKGAERALLDYWWNHGGGREALDETNSGPLAYIVLRDLRLALAARCPTDAATKCTVDHAAALRTPKPEGEPT